MQIKPLFVINRSGLIYRPEGIDLMLAYSSHYIQCNHEKLSKYQREAAQARAVAPEGVPQEESIVADTQLELSKAEAVVTELQSVRGHIIHLYNQDFETWAERFRQTRIQL